MNDNIVILENDVVENVFKPINAFLNDIEPNTKLTFISTYSVTNTKGNTTRRYKFIGDNGKVYNFSEYDFAHFLTNGEPFKDTFRINYEKDAHLRTSFVVLGTSPRLTIAGRKIYPTFCYTGNESYIKQKQLQDESQHPKLLQNLYTTDILESHIDKYYRLVDIDKDIMYYAD